MVLLFFILLVKVNPKLDHALVVSGMLGSIPCTRLVIDPNSSISMIDVHTARKGPIPIIKTPDLAFQLVNGETGPPIGETHSRQALNIQGIQVKLKMPVVDSNNSYDVLLGKDWLLKVDAVIHYNKHQCTISRKGKTALLQGQIYSEEEFELPQDMDTPTTIKMNSDEGQNDEETTQESPILQDKEAQDYLASLMGLDILENESIPPQLARFTGDGSPSRSQESRI